MLALAMPGQRLIEMLGVQSARGLNVNLAGPSNPVTKEDFNAIMPLTRPGTQVTH